ncbi:MAG: glycosyltransferase [Lachnospiraceae bacterium]|nr:glycosyltransferase [Lachnospiraceae bacterium]
MKADRLRYLTQETYLTYERLGDDLIAVNPDQAYLCFENAAFLAPDDGERERLSEKNRVLKSMRPVGVRKVCILILSYNQKGLTENCLGSIAANCDPQTVSLIVLDNASTDGSAEWLGDYVAAHAADRDNCEMVLLCSDENLGFPAGCNAAAAYASPEEDIFLLNNDTQLPANALFWLRMGLYESDDIGAVSGFQDIGSIEQTEKMTLDRPEEFMEYGARHNVFSEHPYEERTKISGFAMLIRHGLFGELGGFDEQFSPGYFEDDDLCYRIREAGYRLMVCRNSLIYHAGGQSFSKRPDVRELFERNRRKFIEKWGNDSIDMIELSDFQMIIWSLDNAFWSGTLDEDDVTPIPRNIDLVRVAADRGILNAVCSVNDRDAVERELQSERFENLWDLFVMSSADRTPKGGRIRKMLEIMAMRPENALYVDGDAFERQEAKRMLPGLQVAPPSILRELYMQLKKYEPTDPEHKRLAQYRKMTEG